MKSGLCRRNKFSIALLLAIALMPPPSVSLSQERQAPDEDARAAKKRMKNFRVSGSPEAITFDGTHIWVASRSGNIITKLRATDGAKLGQFVVGGRPTALA